MRIRTGVVVPAAVRWSARLLAAAALVSAAGTVTAVLALGYLARAAPGYLAGDPDDGTGRARVIADFHATLVLHAAVTIAGLAVLVPLSLVLGRVSGARVAAWTAIGALCSGLALVVASGPDARFGGDPPGPTSSDHLVAGWYPVATSVLVTIQLAVLVPAAVLLMRSSAGDFYHRADAAAAPGLWTYARRPHGGPGGDPGR